MEADTAAADIDTADKGAAGTPWADRAAEGIAVAVVVAVAVDTSARDNRPAADSGSSAETDSDKPVRAVEAAPAAARDCCGRCSLCPSEIARRDNTDFNLNVSSFFYPKSV